MRILKQIPLSNYNKGRKLSIILCKAKANATFFQKEKEKAERRALDRKLNAARINRVKKESKTYALANKQDRILINSLKGIAILNSIRTFPNTIFNNLNNLNYANQSETFKSNGDTSLMPNGHHRSHFYLILHKFLTDEYADESKSNLASLLASIKRSQESSLGLASLYQAGTSTERNQYLVSGKIIKEIEEEFCGTYFIVDFRRRLLKSIRDRSNYHGSDAGKDDEESSIHTKPVKDIIFFNQQIRKPCLIKKGLLRNLTILSTNTSPILR